MLRDFTYIADIAEGASAWASGNQEWTGARPTLVPKPITIKINDNFETSSPGIFACGTLTKGESLIFESGEEGYKVGEIVAKYIKKYVY